MVTLVKTAGPALPSPSDRSARVTLLGMGWAGRSSIALAAILAVWSAIALGLA